MRALVLALFATLGCVPRQEQPPRHETVVCDGAAPTACPASERVAAFDRWAHAVLRSPGSTFSIWAASPGGPPTLLSAACVPVRWGSNVTATKASFLRDGRTRAAEGGAPLPAGCSVTVDQVDRTTLISQGRVRTLAASSDPRHLAVVCDRSDSMLGSSCGAPALEAAYDRWVLDAGAIEGSSFTVYGVGASRDAAVVLRRMVATGQSPGERIALLLGARGLLGGGLQDAPTGSALAEALDVATSELSLVRGHRSILIFSDLRQVTPGTWNFEVAAPEAKEFTGWLRRAGLLSEVRGVEVQACGLHHRRAPGARRYDAPLARRVEHAWSDALQAMGATSAALGAGCPNTLMPGAGS